MKFRRLNEAPSTATIVFDGQAISCQAGESVAAALLAAGVDHFRTTPVSGAPRLPFCMIGNCFDCLVEIDGRSDRQACLSIVADGMIVRSQSGTGRLADK
ncbi:(2Fe-2S)-binding protein [Mesorhizobium sp. LjNodule214]|uniref:(2Fe-2S)-binding protein n=1 Tax=Mesorhizobium sp. LjNodule214 TaxID=3342252 RepID=UPI003ECFBEC9